MADSFEMTPLARGMLQGNATHLIVGLLIARLEKLDPGIRDELAADFDRLFSTMRGQSVLPAEALDEVERAAKALLKTADI